MNQKGKPGPKNLKKEQFNKGHLKLLNQMEEKKALALVSNISHTQKSKKIPELEEGLRFMIPNLAGSNY